jgi:hypothetical protein
MAKLRKKEAPASSGEDVTAIEAQTAAMVEQTKAIEADIDAKLKAVLKNEQAEAETRELEKEPQVNADPLGALVPAKSTPVTVTQVIKLADLTSVELDAYIKDKALRCQRHVAGFTRRAAELYLALFEMEGRFNKQQGARTDLKQLSAQTWTEYVGGSGANYDSYRKWKSRMDAATKQLGVVVALDKGDSKGSKGGSSKNAAVTQAAKELADAKLKLGKSAEDGSEQAKAILADYKKKHEAALVQAQADATADSNAKPSSEFKVNKRLAAIVEVGERYIRVMERVVHTAPQTDRQKDDIEKARKSWRKVLQDARTLSWAVQVIEKQGEEEEAA